MKRPGVSMTNIFKNPLAWTYENFKKNTAKMLVVTGTIGWGLSSAAQGLAVLFNPKISKEQKGYLLPQEGADAIVNIALFLSFTRVAQKVFSKLASTGKFAPKQVREFLNKNKELYGDKVGKLSLDLDEVLKTDNKFPKEAYYNYKNYITTVGTVGASILASNIVTPVVRNYTASLIQDKYLKYKPQNPSGNMKI